MKKYTYICDRCGQEITVSNPNFKCMCYNIAKNRPFGMCLGQYKRKVSNDTKQIRFFFHAIANYFKIKRILRK